MAIIVQYRLTLDRLEDATLGRLSREDHRGRHDEIRWLILEEARRRGWLIDIVATGEPFKVEATREEC